MVWVYLHGPGCLSDILVFLKSQTLEIKPQPTTVISSSLLKEKNATNSRFSPSSPQSQSYITEYCWSVTALLFVSNSLQMLAKVAFFHAFLTSVV